MMRAYLEEFVGTLFFIYIVLATGNALAIGAALALVMFVTNGRGHFNPALTITLASGGKFPINKVIPYNLAQILGGLVAMEIYKRYKF